MIDIPLGKALVPVEYDESKYDEMREKCFFRGCKSIDGCPSPFPCVRQGRKDGKYVIFKLVDYPVEVKK